MGQNYSDIELRLQTQRTKQERLLALLEKAATMEDIISLENALSETEYQIEQYTSDLKRYDSLIDFATIELRLTEVPDQRRPGEVAPLGARVALCFWRGSAFLWRRAGKFGRLAGLSCGGCRGAPGRFNGGGAGRPEAASEARRGPCAARRPDRGNRGPVEAGGWVCDRPPLLSEGNVI